MPTPNPKAHLAYTLLLPEGKPQNPMNDSFCHFQNSKYLGKTQKPIKNKKRSFLFFDFV
jgi:hypothetical protein